MPVNTSSTPAMGGSLVFCTPLVLKSRNTVPLTILAGGSRAMVFVVSMLLAVFESYWRPWIAALLISGPSYPGFHLDDDRDRRRGIERQRIELGDDRAVRRS